MSEEWNPDRFWEWGRWAQRMGDGVEQFDHLFECGLSPSHYLLDVGCGWLRGGINFIEYLDVGHYYGFDKEQGQLDRGEVLLRGKNLLYKKPVIGLVANTRYIKSFIDRERVTAGFDFMIAYSVFTHTDPYMTERIFTNVIPFLKITGKFFATFHRYGGDVVDVGKCHLNRSDEYNVVRYPASFFLDLADKNGMVVDFLSLDDVHGQDWMCFCKEG